MCCFCFVCMCVVVVVVVHFDMRCCTSNCVVLFFVDLYGVVQVVAHLQQVCVSDGRHIC